jgi:MFS family permease
MGAPDVMETLDLALAHTGVESVQVRHRSRLLSDNGPAYVSKELREYLDERGYRDAKMRIGVWVSLAWIPFGLLYPIMPTVYLAIAFMIPPAFIGAMTIGVQAAAIQEIMPNTLRGQGSAIFLFFNSLIGLGLGPGALGLATDYLFQDEMKMNYSIVLVGCSAHLMAALLLYVGMKHYRKTLAELDEWTSVAAAEPVG